MSKGYVYIMTSAVDGIIKIGKSKDWNRRCKDELESNGYKNINALKTYYVVECEDYDEIESIMHDIFRESRVSNFEAFAVDKDRAKRVLSKMGIQVYPENQTDCIKRNTNKIIQNTFTLLNIPIGSTLELICKPSIKVTTIDNKNKIKLSDGTICSISAGAAVYVRKYTNNKKGSINGFAEFSYNGTRLWDIRQKVLGL